MLKYRDAAPHPYNLIFIDSEEINWYTDYTKIYEIDFLKFGTVIRGGDWDKRYLKKQRTEPRFAKTQISFERHFNEGVPWEETEIYDYALKNPDITPLYEPGENLNQRLKAIDELYWNIRNHGYKSQRELQDRSHEVLSERRNRTIPEFATPEGHEIGVAITRNGEIAHFYGGNHRVHLAKVLQLDNIPVRVVIRHKKWQQIRNEVAQSNVDEKINDKLLTHPDLQNLL